MPRKKKIWRAGLKLIAEAMSNEFHRVITKQLVHSWKAWNPPFPAPHQNNQYDQEECFEWYRTHPKTQGQTQSELSLVDQAYQAKQKLTILEHEREQREYDILEGHYIPRADARRKTEGAIKTYHAFVRSSLEHYAVIHRTGFLKSIGIADGLINAFTQWDAQESKKVIDEIEARAEQEANASDTETI